MAYQTRKFVAENEDKVSRGHQGPSVEEAAKGVDEALKGDDIDAIKAAVEKLSTETQEMGKAIYEADAAQGANPARGCRGRSCRRQRCRR